MWKLSFRMKLIMSEMTEEERELRMIISGEK
jgi:hypothetical protein